MRRIFCYLIRAFIALVLLSTAVGKALDPAGFVDVIDTYQTVPSILHWPSALAMIVTEFVLAVWLASGKRLPRAALASVALHIVFIVFTGQALARGLQIDNCGCFGVFFARPLTVVTLVEDGVMAGLSLLLARLASGPARVLVDTVASGPLARPPVR